MMDVEHTEPPLRHLRFWEARAIFDPQRPFAIVK